MALPSAPLVPEGGAAREGLSEAGTAPCCLLVNVILTSSRPAGFIQPWGGRGWAPALDGTPWSRVALGSSPGRVYCSCYQRGSSAQAGPCLPFPPGGEGGRTGTDRRAAWVLPIVPGPAPASLLPTVPPLPREHLVSIKALI